jgi:hypothetical protein
MSVTAFEDITQSFMDDWWISAISSASGQTDLKYIVEIFSDDSSGATKFYEGKVYPEPSSKYMYFNIAPIVRNQYTEEFFEFDFSNKYNLANLSGEVCYRIGTDYSGITTLNQAANTLDVNTRYLSRPKYKNKRYLKKSWYDDNWERWLTDRKTVSSINKNTDRFFIGCRLDANEEGFIKWESFNEGGGSISSSSYVEINPGYLGAEHILNIGPDGLDDLTGSSPNITTCAYYIVTLKWNAVTTSQDTFLTFRINKACNPKYQSVPIHFYNRFLSVDTMRFDLVSRTTVDVERKSYQQRDYRFSGSSVLYTDSSAPGTTVYRENKINYNSTYNYTMKLTSDLLDDQDWEWLEDLIESPKIYMEEDGYFYPVTIKATNYEISKYVNNRLRPLEIEIEFNSPRLSSAR